MSSSMNTILIVGGSGGIGEAFAKRFHAMGKQVIVTGRQQAKLDKLKVDCKGLQTYIMDMMDIAALPKHVAALAKSYPKIDTVWINGGIQYLYQLSELASSSDGKIRAEIDTNVTAPMVLARHFIPFLLNQGNPTNFMITSSGLAFVPMGQFPVYCPTKAFVHHFLVGLRQQMAGTSINVIELAPPRVETELDVAHADKVAVPAMPLQDFTNEAFKILDENKAEDLKEVAVGFAGNGANAWRESIGKILENMKLGG